VDNATGANTPVTLTVGTGGGGPYMDQGANAASGTDAYNVFNGKVSCAGLLSYFGGGNLTLRFSEMDPSLFYEVVLFGNRNAASYTDRLTTVTLSGADAFENRSTAGAAVAGPSDSSTVMCNGWNGAAGLVVRYAQVKPGADGEMTLTVADETSRFYLNALMLRTTSEDKTLIPDSTHDGLADDWQTAYFGEPTAPMAAPDLDADGDGMANAQEYVAGTDPSAADSVLDVRLEWANGRMWVSFDTLPAQGGSYDGRTRLYALETSPLDAVNPSWSLVPGYDRITGDGTVVSIPIVGTSSAQYRVRVWLE
ncbi:MAG: hypothetical protein JXR37_13190, partial [Kiritimatiellae bacterium]|nr:hypothetical protein [Kiritimatiellia bacterium]